MQCNAMQCNAMQSKAMHCNAALGCYELLTRAPRWAAFETKLTFFLFFFLVLCSVTCDRLLRPPNIALSAALARLMRARAAVLQPRPGNFNLPRSRKNKSGDVRKKIELRAQKSVRGCLLHDATKQEGWAEGAPKAQNSGIFLVAIEVEVERRARNARVGALLHDATTQEGWAEGAALGRVRCFDGNSSRYSGRHKPRHGTKPALAHTQSMRSTSS
jgi:hypothetical protein